MRVHLVGMPHLDPVREVEWCAFSQKTRRLCDMLTSVGHEVIFYGGPHLDGAVAEHVVVVTDEDRQAWFGEESWAEKVFDRWNPADTSWPEMNAATVIQMTERLQPTDIIGLTMGRCQQTIADAFPNHVIAEVGIGYEGPIVGTHWCVESEAWRHYLYGKYGITDGRFFDAVVPNAFDPVDYMLRSDHDGYLLYLGRMTARKGLGVVAELAKRHHVITAGQGDERVPLAEHVGVVVGDAKRKLLAGAKALLCPTTYIEPFGGVTIEAFLSGTPVISTPWGAFSETVIHRFNGYRCHSLSQFEDAIANLHHLVPSATIHSHAAAIFGTAACAQRYDRWLRRLGTLHDKGWYS